MKKNFLSLLFLFSLLFSPESALALKTVSFIPQWNPQAQCAGYYVAAEKGFYKKHGLDAKILVGGPDHDPVQYLKSGKAQFAPLFLTTALDSRDKGVPLINLAQVVKSSNLMLVAWKDRKIEKIGDLDKKRVSLWGDWLSTAYLGFFRKNAVKPVAVPQFFTVNLFLRKGVDACAAMHYNEFHQILQAGVDPEELTTFHLKNEQFDLPEDGIYCLESTYRKSPADCRAFALASLEGWTYVRQHPAEALDIVMERVKAANVPTNRAHMKWMLETILGTIDEKEPTLSRRTYAETVKLMKRQGLLNRTVPYETFCVEEARDVP